MDGKVTLQIWVTIEERDQARRDADRLGISVSKLLGDSYFGRAKQRDELLEEIRLGRRLLVDLMADLSTRN